jgi:hypothetical protein
VARLRAYDLRLHEARLNASVFVTDLCEGRWGMVGKKYGKMASSPKLPGNASGTSGTSAYYEPVSASSEQVLFLLLYGLFLPLAQWDEDDEEKMPCGCHVARVFQDINC